MTDQVYGYALFCDDIRQEVGGKQTLVGLYTGGMSVQGKSPVVIPLFSALLNLVLPIDLDFNRVEFKLIKELDDQSVDIFAAHTEEAKAQLVSRLDGVAPPEKLMAQIPVRMGNFVAEDGARIKARAFVDGREVRLGTLHISFSEIEHST